MKNSDLADASSERLGIQVISRAASLLRALQNHPNGQSLGELSKSIGIPRSTVQRIVDALHREGFVIAASSSNGVRLGPALLALASATRFRIGDVARPMLEALAKECGETVDLSLADQGRAVFIDQISGTHRLTAVSAVGLYFPLHSSANGKAMLAAMLDADITKLKKKIQLSATTRNSITNWDAMDEEIKRIRAAGVAYDNEENSVGISAVSVAISTPHGEIAAISIPVPTFRFTENKQKLEKMLRFHCSELQGKLNG